MRNQALISTAFAAVVFAITGVLAPLPAGAQMQLAQAQAPAPPKPYKVVAVKLPEPLKDASFEAFRKQLATIADSLRYAGRLKLSSRPASLGAGAL